jgi:hypothetical protein
MDTDKNYCHDVDKIASASWTAPALWRFVSLALSKKGGRGLPQSKTLREFGMV